MSYRQITAIIRKLPMEKEVEDNKTEKWVGYLENQKKTDDLIEELRRKIIKETDFGESE